MKNIKNKKSEKKEDKKVLKKRDDSSESDYDSEDDSYTEDSESCSDDYETDSEEEFTKTRSKNSKYEEEIDSKKIRKTINTLFPKKSSHSKKSKKSKSKKESESESESDSEESESEDEDEEEPRKKGKSAPIIFTFSDVGGANSVEEEYEQMIEEDKHDIYESEDERTFMKESYEALGVPSAPPSDGPTESSNEKANHKKRSKKTKIENTKTRKTDLTIEKDEKEDTVKSQYQELIQLKKELINQLRKKPNSSILRNAIQECGDSITKLVKKSRTKNTKSYYKLVNEDENEKQNMNELTYFKKKMSHQEQVKIMKDLKEINSINNIEKPYRLALLQSNIPIRFKAIALQKLGVLRSMEPSDTEYYKLKNWVDGFMRVPFGVYRHLTVRLDDGLDSCHAFMENAKTTLDNCAYGLNDAKLQILQMVGQWIANPSAMGTAIAIKGPMGTGKTTLVKDGISKILGREFAFIALGGAGDSSFLEGHSYTYEGSSWGKIMQILMDSKSMNPVIYFDELDKISDTPRGEEIVSILTHLTDTTQNSQFHDKYFSEVDFDLSKCLFIFSYNDESKVNSILKDRMYRIQTKGYDTKEKVIIARKHLLPKIREQVSFLEEDVVIPDETLQYLISNESLCKGEQGVRNLKRCLEIIHTKLNLFRLIKPDVKLFAKEIEMEVVFPFTVLRKHVDILIKNDDPTNQSMLAMYV